MKQLRAGVLGAGQVGRHHVRLYREIEDADLVAVADPDDDALTRATQGTLTTGYADYRAMLDSEDLDLVSVAVPTQLHYEVACEAMKRGIHVLVEKPLALTIEEGQAMIDAAESLGVKLMVGHIERFNPAVIEVKRRLMEQELGRIFQISATRVGPLPERIKGVGVVLDLATHDIDVMRYLIEAEVERIYAETDRETSASEDDLIAGLLRFENGVIGVLSINWLTPTKIRQLSILGEMGMYVVDYLTQDLYWYRNSKMPGDWDMLSVFRGVSEGDMTKVQVQKKEPLRIELETFVTAVREDRESPVSGHHALMAVSLAHAFIESGDTHQLMAVRP
jgi:predicted dehydrogenase